MPRRKSKRNLKKRKVQPIEEEEEEEHENSISPVPKKTRRQEAMKQVVLDKV